MEKNYIDTLNKLFTNTLVYRELLEKLAQKVSDEATVNKLNEFVGVADQEHNRLMQMISDEGGNVQSSERQTDQSSVCWTPQSKPDTNNMSSVLNCLIAAEKNKLEDYRSIYNSEHGTKASKTILERHKKQAEAQLHYLESAAQTLENRN